MLTVETPASMRAWADERRLGGHRIALVPTMGALHDGHLTLIDRARELCDDVVVSIFVNRLQFNRSDDFTAYPRTIERDLALCAERGVSAVYTPTHEAMYPLGFETHVEPGSLAEPLEGAGRPGHFRGVATVVAKLFNAVRPDVAVFGRKDFQQLAIVTRMALDLDMGIEVVGVETVREADGLAMSSRNARLSPELRHAARVVPRALEVVASAVEHGYCVQESSDVPGVMSSQIDQEAALAHLRELGAGVIGAEPLARLEYFDIVDPSTLRAPVVGSGLLAVTAAWFGEVRLIDNRLLLEPSP